MMDFEDIIRNSSCSTQKEIVGLAIYYLDEVRGETPVSATDVRRLLNDTRTNVTKPNISAYPSQIADEGYLTRRDGGYILTYEGQSYYRSLFDSDKIPSERRDDFFLNIDSDERFYCELITDINKTYQIKVYDATLVLTRKLFESLLIDILRGHYGNQQIKMFFNPDRAMYHPFSVLIDNFEENYQDFQHYSMSLDVGFIRSMNDFRIDANDSAHSIEIDVTEDMIDDLKPEATHIAKILLNVWEKIQISNDTSPVRNQ